MRVAQKKIFIEMKTKADAGCCFISCEFYWEKVLSHKHIILKITKRKKKERMFGTRLRATRSGVFCISVMPSTTNKAAALSLPLLAQRRPPPFLSLFTNTTSRITITILARRNVLLFPLFGSVRFCFCTFNTGSIDEHQPRSSELVELEYADLNLNYNFGEVGHVRVRQHANPLSSSFMLPPKPPNWSEVFKDSSLPLMVDIGCGSGRFLIWLAKHFPQSKNYLGLEIRHKLVKRAQFWVKELGFENIYFMFANATISFDQLVCTYPGPLVFVSILCPDPHFKRKHHKRRVLQKPLVDSISKNLNPTGQIFVQSDVLEVALDMRDQFDSRSDEFEHASNVACDPQGWILKNPMGIRTEREIHAESGGARVYRRMYRKRAE